MDALRLMAAGPAAGSRHGRLRLRPLQDRHRPEQLAHRRPDARGAAVRAAAGARRPARRDGARALRALRLAGRHRQGPRQRQGGAARPGRLRARHGRRRRHPGAAAGASAASAACTCSARTRSPSTRRPTSSSTAARRCPSTPTACASRPSTPPAPSWPSRSYYSVGGGFVVSDEVAADGSLHKVIAPDTTVLPLPVPQRRRAAGADARARAARSPR